MRGNVMCQNKTTQCGLTLDLILPQHPGDDILQWILTSREVSEGLLSLCAGKDSQREGLDFS